MDLNYASVGRRIWGGLVDLIILIIFAFLYIHLFGTKVAEGTYHVGGFNASIMFLLMFLYFVVLEKTTGRTIGKYLAKTQVVNLEGAKISWGQSLARNILRPVDGLVVYLVGIISIISTKRNQRLGDLAAKTVVIKL